MSDVWTIHFDRDGRPVGVSGPTLPVPEGGRENGMATMDVVPLAPLMRGCSGPVDRAFAALRERLPYIWNNGEPAWQEVRMAAALAGEAALGWRRDFSREPRDAEDAWGVK
jgi:hypothetical protein